MEINPLYAAQGQAQLWLLFCAAGAVSAALSALVMAFFGSCRLRAFGALLSGALSALVFCISCVLLTGGSLRFYMFPAMGAGALLFSLLVLRPVRWVLHRVAAATAPVFRAAAQSPIMQKLLK